MGQSLNSFYFVQLCNKESYNEVKILKMPYPRIRLAYEFLPWPIFSEIMSIIYLLFKNNDNIGLQNKKK